MLFDRAQIALVTGAGSGIGRAVALDLASEGATVVVNYHKNQTGAEEVVEEIRSQGRDALGCRADVTDETEVRTMLRTVRRELGSLDILVNNAGGNDDGLLAMMSTQKWEHVIALNLTGTFLCAREALKLMMVRRRGSIVNVSSIAGVVGTEGQANYAAAKGGVNAFTKTLAREGAPFGVRANAVTPGLIETRMTAAMPAEVLARYSDAVPLKRLGRPEEVAHLISFLASDHASYLTGAVIGIDGGLAP
jgi:3-oxoacyl-[acyl-carrier protein] reductase